MRPRRSSDRGAGAPPAFVSSVRLDMEAEAPGRGAPEVTLPRPWGVAGSADGAVAEAGGGRPRAPGGGRRRSTRPRTASELDVSL